MFSPTRKHIFQALWFGLALANQAQHAPSHGSSKHHILVGNFGQDYNVTEMLDGTQDVGNGFLYTLVVDTDAKSLALTHTTRAAAAHPWLSVNVRRPPVDPRPFLIPRFFCNLSAKRTSSTDRAGLRPSMASEHSVHTTSSPTFPFPTSTLSPRAEPNLLRTILLPKRESTAYFTAWILLRLVGRPGPWTNEAPLQRRFKRLSSQMVRPCTGSRRRLTSSTCILLWVQFEILRNDGPF
jgi:hypothetical protein